MQTPQTVPGMHVAMIAEEDATGRVAELYDQIKAKVARAAYKVTDADWERAADAGWSSDELLDAALVTTLSAFVNRVVDA